MTNLAAVLERSAALYPERVAIVAGPRRWTYAALEAEASRVAALLIDRGIEPGDRVALTAPNVPEFTACYFGILKAGAVVVPLNVLLKAREFAYHLADCDVRAVITHEGVPGLPILKEVRAGYDQVPTCRHLLVLPSADGADVPERENLRALVANRPTAFTALERDDDDTAVILYTSGTTGQPKGAELKHSSVRINALAADDLYGADAAHPDTYLCVLPLFHSFGQTAMQNAAIGYGGTLVLLPRFEPGEVLATLAGEGVSVFGGVPTMYWALLQALDESTDVSAIAEHLRVAISGGSALPAEIHRTFRDRFGVTIIEGYGLSETSPGAAFSPWGAEPRIGSIGKPLPGVEMKLITEDWSTAPDGEDVVGEIAIRGYNVMKGYYGRPAETAAAIKDGWFRTGDLGRRDADGYYYIVDRVKDLIIRGGYNVYPREIEELLMEHPAVSLVAVIGTPHESHGEEIKAIVVRTPGVELSAEELVAWSRERLAAYKYPRLVEFRDALPMTATGKILKREI